MTLDENIFSQLKENSFIKDFLDSCEHQNRFNISVISSVCTELAEAEDDECTSEFRFDCVNKIIDQCKHMMKLISLYSMLCNALSDTEPTAEKTDISEFLSVLVKACSEYLTDVCRLNFTSGEKAETSVIKELLEFALVLYIRYAALNGAKVIDIAYAHNGGYIVVSVSVSEGSEPAEEEKMHEKVTVDYAEDIIYAAAKKMKAEFVRKENGMELHLPIKIDGSAALNSSSKPYGNKRFDTLGNILSDVRDITLL